MRLQRRNPSVHESRHLHAVVRLRRTGETDITHAVPRLEALLAELSEDPAIAGVTSSIESGEADSPMISLVGHTGDHAYRESTTDDHLRAVSSDRAGDVAPQRQAVLDRAVTVIKEFDDLHADLAGRFAFFVLPQRAGFVRVHRIDPGLAARHHEIGDLLALAGPLGDRG